MGVRELEHLGEEIREKFRSESMQGGRSEREVIMLVMSLKLRDEKRHQKELKKKRNTEKELWKGEIGSNRLYSKLLF